MHIAICVCCRRSAVSKQACRILGLLSAALGPRFDMYALYFLPIIFKITVITVQVGLTDCQSNWYCEMHQQGPTSAGSVTTAKNTPSTAKHFRSERAMCSIAHTAAVVMTLHIICTTQTCGTFLQLELCQVQESKLSISRMHNVAYACTGDG